MALKLMTETQSQFYILFSLFKAFCRKTYVLQKQKYLESWRPIWLPMHSLAACLISSRVLTNRFSTPRDMTPRVVPFFLAAWEEGFKYTIPFNQTSQCGSSCKVLGAYTTKKNRWYRWNLQRIFQISRRSGAVLNNTNIIDVYTLVLSQPSREMLL